MVYVPKKLRGGSWGHKYGNALALGTNFSAGMLVFTFLGNFVGKKLGHTDGGTLIGLFLGLFYGGYEVWKVVQQLQESEEVDEPTGD